MAFKLPIPYPQSTFSLQYHSRIPFRQWPIFSSRPLLEVPWAGLSTTLRPLQCSLVKINDLIALAANSFALLHQYHYHNFLSSIVANHMLCSFSRIKNVCVKSKRWRTCRMSPVHGTPRSRWFEFLSMYLWLSGN